MTRFSSDGPATAQNRMQTSQQNDHRHSDNSRSRKITYDAVLHMHSIRNKSSQLTESNNARKVINLQQLRAQHRSHMHCRSAISISRSFAGAKYRMTRHVVNDFDFKFKPVINSNQQ